MSVLQDKISILIEKIHLRVFGNEMGEEMRTFLSHLSWSFVGGGIASSVMMVVNIAVGRLIGPTEFGKYSLVLTLSQIFLIPILFSLDTVSTRYIAENTDRQKIKQHISSAFYFVLASVIFLTTFSFFVLKDVSVFFNIDLTLLSVAVFLAVALAIKAILDSIIKGLHLFKTQFLVRILEAFSVLFFFSLLFLFLGFKTYVYYVSCLVLASFIAILFYLKIVFSYLGSFSGEALRKQLSYGKIIFAGAVLIILFNSLDKFIILKYLGVRELGIYSAYFMASINMIAQLTQMFVNVFFPSIAKVPQRPILLKLERLFKILFAPTALIISCIIFMIMSFFGKDYGINIQYIFGFSLIATLQIILIIYYSVFAASPKEIYIKYILRFNAVNFLHVLAYCFLIYMEIVSFGWIIALLILNNIVNIILQRNLIMRN